VKEDLKSEQIGDMKLHYVKTVEEVMEIALEQRVERPALGTLGETPLT